MRIQGGKTLIGDAFVETDIRIDQGEGVIESTTAMNGQGASFDACDLYVLPGIVDIHADAFERQVMPRPGVGFPLDVALADSDRQVVSNGITTIFHGVTCSWEPGLRGVDNARTILSTIETMREQLAADTRFHLRHETHNLDAEPEVTDWLSERRIDLLAFNNHVPTGARPKTVVEMAQRCGLTREDFLALVERVKSRAEEVPDSIGRLAASARQTDVPMLSHDDMSPEQRSWFRALDCRLCEFPTTAETAQAAADAGDDIVLGAPNVVRGGSHIGWVKAADMITQGLCTVLASDYYYPAPLLAAFRLARDGVAPLERAWGYVSERPAKAAGLDDRGVIEAGRRADLIAVDASNPQHPRIVATLAKGRIVHLTEANRLN